MRGGLFFKISARLHAVKTDKKDSTLLQTRKTHHFLNIIYNRILLMFFCLKVFFRYTTLIWGGCGSWRMPVVSSSPWAEAVKGSSRGRWSRRPTCHRWQHWRRPPPLPPPHPAAPDDDPVSCPCGVAPPPWYEYYLYWGTDSHRNQISCQLTSYLTLTQHTRAEPLDNHLNWF